LIRDSVFHYGELAARFTDAHHNKIARTRIWGGTGIRDGVGLELLEGSDANTFVASDLDGSSFGIRIMNSARNRFMNGLIAGGFGTRDADRTVIAGNLLDGAGQGFGALYVRGNRSTIRDNVGSTIGVEGDRNLVVANQTEGAFFDTPIEVAGGDRNVVRRNSATGARADVGPVIWVGAAASRTTLARNTASAARSGNESMGGPFAIGDGIRVEAPGTLIRANTATDNDALGINAVDGVIDGGDNHASGNGDPRQCVGVVCTP
jgi:hypothetical protein